ncbi:uncharacterized protein ISCGN_012102 [Ixodes scapularis]
MCELEGKPYVVVKFPDEDDGDTVAVVHQRWINGDWCYWPNAKSSKMINMLTERGANPTKDWKRVLCIPIQSFQSFEKARRKLKTAEDTSDLQSETDLGKGKRKRKATRISDSSDSDVPQRRRRQPMPLAGCNAMDDEGSSGPPTPPPAATLRALKQSSTTFSSTPACRNVASKTVSKEPEPEGFRRHTLEILHMIRLRLDNLTALMGTVLEALNKHKEEDDDDNCPVQEPHASYDSFMEFECQLQASEAMRKKLTQVRQPALLVFSLATVVQVNTMMVFSELPVLMTEPRFSSSLEFLGEIPDFERERESKVFAISLRSPMPAQIHHPFRSSVLGTLMPPRRFISHSPWVFRRTFVISSQLALQTRPINHVTPIEKPEALPDLGTLSRAPIAPTLNGRYAGSLYNSARAASPANHRRSGGVHTCAEARAAVFFIDAGTHAVLTRNSPA